MIWAPFLGIFIGVLCAIFRGKFFDHFGMLFAITFGIVIVPFFFVLIYKLKQVNFKQILLKGKSFMPIIVAALVTMSATSCKIGKKYTRPDLNLPETFEVVGDSSSVADIGWGTLYQDTVLQSLIEKALHNNKDMCIAAAKIKELMAAKRISNARLYPSATFSQFKRSVLFAADIWEPKM